MRLAWDRNYFPARREGVHYSFLGRGWGGWYYFGPFMIRR